MVFYNVNSTLKMKNNKNKISQVIKALKINRNAKENLLAIVKNICDLFSRFSKFLRKTFKGSKTLTLSWRRPLSYRNQSTDLQSKSTDRFLYDNGLHHERVNACVFRSSPTITKLVAIWNMFKVNNKDSRTISLKSFLVCLLLTLNIFYTLFSCFYWWLWIGKYLLGNI